MSSSLSLEEVDVARSTQEQNGRASSQKHDVGCRASRSSHVQMTLLLRGLDVDVSPDTLKRGIRSWEQKVMRGDDWYKFLRAHPSGGKWRPAMSVCFETQEVLARSNPACEQSTAGRARGTQACMSVVKVVGGPARCFAVLPPRYSMLFFLFVCSVSKARDTDLVRGGSPPTGVGAA